MGRTNDKHNKNFNFLHPVKIIIRVQSWSISDCSRIIAAFVKRISHMMSYKHTKLCYIIKITLMYKILWHVIVFFPLWLRLFLTYTDKCYGRIGNVLWFNDDSKWIMHCVALIFVRTSCDTFSSHHNCQATKCHSLTENAKQWELKCFQQIAQLVLFTIYFLLTCFVLDCF